MKKIFILLLIIFTSNIKSACEDIICPVQNPGGNYQENIINKITGIHFLSKRITELAIEKELSDEFQSKTDAKLEIFNTKRLKNGEFKSLSITGEKLKYKALSLSNFYARTLCSYNRIIYKNKRIYYPEDISFKYTAEITNEDLKNTIKSEEFQKELKRKKIRSNNINLFEIKEPEAQIKDNMIELKIPLQTLFGRISLNVKSEIEAVNNTIILKNIFFNTKSNIIKENVIMPVIESINPIEYNIDSINGKYCKAEIISAEIRDNKIEIQGIFRINKNIGGDK